VYLYVALLNGHCAKLLYVGASLTDVDQEGLGALSWAAINGHLHCVELLLDRGCDIDHNDNIKRTPLHLASLYGHEQVVRSFFILELWNFSNLSSAVIQSWSRGLLCQAVDEGQTNTVRDQDKEKTESSNVKVFRLDASVASAKYHIPRTRTICGIWYKGRESVA